MSLTRAREDGTTGVSAVALMLLPWGVEYGRGNMIKYTDMISKKEKVSI